jgi:hypothetical protein
VDGRIRLQGRWDAIFLRVREGARPRKLELRIRGRGDGVLYVGEQSALGPGPRCSAYPVGGAIRIRHPYSFAMSGGPEILVTTGRSPGQLDIESVDLVAAGDPDDVIRIGGR